LSIIKAVYDITSRVSLAAEGSNEYKGQGSQKPPINELKRIIAEMENQMKAAAKELQFEKAAALRDQIYELKALMAEESDLPGWQKARLMSGELDL
jgi:excinuclease ABC subunit B